MKSQLKMWGAVGLAAGLTLTAAGCAPSAESGGKTLDVWLPTTFAGATSDEEKAVWGDIFAPFEEANGVEIKVTLVPWSSYEEKYLTGVSSGDGPDVGYMYTEMMGDYVTNGALASFDEHLSDETKENALFLPQGQVDGKQYAMPYAVGGMRVLYGNMDLLAQAGITDMPTTWDELMDDSATLTDAGITAMVQSWGAPDRGMLNQVFFPLLWQAGGDILTEDGTKTAFAGPEGIAAANLLKEMIDTGAMPSTVSGMDADAVRAMFMEGKSAFLYESDSRHAEFSETVNLAFTPSLEDKQKGTFVASDSLVMLESCEDKALCTDLVEFMLEAPQMEKFHAGIVAFPPVATDEAPDADSPFTEAYQELAGDLRSLPIAAGGAAVYNSLYQNLQQMILGQKTPEQALKDAAAAGDASLAEAR